MNQKLRFYLLISAVCFATTSFAQTKTSSTDTSKTVIIFNSGSPSAKKTYSAGNQIVKIDPLGFIFGKIPVSYERRLSDLFSVQLSAGLTSKNYLRSFWQNEEAEFNDDYSSNNPNMPAGYTDQTDPLYNYDHRKADLGYTVSIQPRVYLNEEALEGSFFGLGLSMSRYNFSTPGLVPTTSGLEFTGPTKKEYEKIKDITVYFGWQRLYDRISLEYSTGLGIRKTDGVKYIAGSNGAGFYESLSKYSKKSGVNFELSFKLGFQL